VCILSRLTHNKSFVWDRLKRAALYPPLMLIVERPLIEISGLFALGRKQSNSQLIQHTTNVIVRSSTK
jgi:hypothetical protein